MIKTIIETNRWHVYWIKTISMANGNGYAQWSLVFRKVCGNGDDGVRSLNYIQSTKD